MTIIDAWPPPDRVAQSVFGMIATGRSKLSSTPLISVNGAALTSAVAKMRGRRLIAIFDDAAAARSVWPKLRDALSRATVATVLRGIRGAPLSPATRKRWLAPIQGGLRQRTIGVVWHCPSAQASPGEPRGQVWERLTIAQRSAPHSLVIVGDSRWWALRGILAKVGVR